MSGRITLGIYIAIGITGAAFGQPKAPNVFDYATSPVPISTNRLPPASDGWLPPDRRTVETVALQPKPPPPRPVEEPLPGQPLYKAPPPSKTVTTVPVPATEADKTGRPVAMTPQPVTTDRGYFPNPKAVAPIPSPPGWKVGLTPAPLPTPERTPETVVIKYGQGGRVDVHTLTYAAYRSRKTNVELRGPCYSACTMVLTYMEPDRLCIGQGAFMAFHAVRSLETKVRMDVETRFYYVNLPPPIRQWIDRNGGYDALPLDGFWTMYDHELWAMGYPRCAP